MNYVFCTLCTFECEAVADGGEGGSYALAAPPALNLGMIHGYAATVQQFLSRSLRSCSFSFDVMKRAAPSRLPARFFFAHCNCLIHDERVQVGVHPLAHHNLHPAGQPDGESE